MSAQSKLLAAAINCSCHAYMHPWTTSCVCGVAGMMLASIPSCLRTYTTVYGLALLLRLRLPTLQQLKHSFFGILQSSAFLSTNAYGFCLCVCLLRRLLGRFYYGSLVFWPAFVASLAALSIERPARRASLAFYVANVGLETLWRLLEARGVVRSLPKAPVIIMGLSLTALLYLYRLGMHRNLGKDITYQALGVVMGKEEQGPLKSCPINSTTSSRPLDFGNISSYGRLFSSKHLCCPHGQSCAVYVLQGALKPLLGGLGFQVALKLLFNLKKIISWKMAWRKQIFNKNSLKLGLTMGSFTLLYKLISCALRHACGYDHALFAIPAGLLGSIGLLQFPNTTISLYIMWKALHLLYNWGISRGKLPEVPHFTTFLYAFFTAILFHASILEPGSLRASYYKFLMSTSGNRICRFGVQGFDAFGHEGSAQVQQVVRRLKIDMSSPLPSVPLIV